MWRCASVPEREVRARLRPVQRRLSQLAGSPSCNSAVSAAIRVWPSRKRVHAIESTGPDFPDATAFLDLLAVSHATAAVPLAALSDRIGQAVGRLLGNEGQRLGFHRNRMPAGFDGFAGCPKLTPEALDDARKAFESPESVRHRGLAQVVSPCANARKERTICS